MRDRRSGGLLHVQAASQLEVFKVAFVRSCNRICPRFGAFAHCGSRFWASLRVRKLACGKNFGIDILFFSAGRFNSICTRASLKSQAGLQKRCSKHRAGLAPPERPQPLTKYLSFGMRKRQLQVGHSHGMIE